MPTWPRLGSAGGWCLRRLCRLPVSQVCSQVDHERQGVGQSRGKRAVHGHRHNLEEASLWGRWDRLRKGPEAGSERSGWVRQRHDSWQAICGMWGVLRMAKTWMRPARMVSGGVVRPVAVARVHGTSPYDGQGFLVLTPKAAQEPPGQRPGRFTESNKTQHTWLLVMPVLDLSMRGEMGCPIWRSWSPWRNSSCNRCAKCVQSVNNV